MTPTTEDWIAMLDDCCLPDHALDALLRDDVPHGDLTTELLGIAALPARLEMRMRRAGVLAGVEEAARMFALAGAQVEVLAHSGARLSDGAMVLVAHADAGRLHRTWKAAQILVEYASGVATRAAAIVAAAVRDGQMIPVACTRKTVPGTKALGIKAIRAGGAWPHRLGLSDTVLVFPEHLAFIAPQAQAAAIARLRATSPERMLVAEACDVAQVMTLARAGIDVVQLEKFTPGQVAQVVAERRASGLAFRVAVAGGVHERNAAEYAAAGADVLVTSAPYYAPPHDIAVTLAPAA